MNGDTDVPVRTSPAISSEISGVRECIQKPILSKSLPTSHSDLWAVYRVRPQEHGSSIDSNVPYSRVMSI